MAESKRHQFENRRSRFIKVECRVLEFVALSTHLTRVTLVSSSPSISLSLLAQWFRQTQCLSRLGGDFSGVFRLGSTDQSHHLSTNHFFFFLLWNSDDRLDTQSNLSFTYVSSQRCDSWNQVMNTDRLSRTFCLSWTFRICSRGLLTFLSSPLLGAYSDIWGRKSFLLITVFFTCCPIPLMKISPM